MQRWIIVVNENMHDAGADIRPIWDEDKDWGLTGWERVWGIYLTREEAEEALAEARAYARTRAI